jgi:hypothetical protein
VARRTEIQLALLVIGLVTWGYGQRIDDGRLRAIGIVFFAAATVLRFFKKRDPT